jgi:hypothetical protein
LGEDLGVESLDRHAYEAARETKKFHRLGHVVAVESLGVGLNELAEGYRGQTVKQCHDQPVKQCHDQPAEQFHDQPAEQYQRQPAGGYHHYLCDCPPRQIAFEGSRMA